MTGWMIIFAVTSTASGALGSVLASSLFGTLFVLALCAKAVRGAE